jgi:antitoxin ChpS
MMFQTKIRKVGNSSVVTLTAEMLAALDAKEGDTVYVTHSDDNGLKLQLNDPRTRGCPQGSRGFHG